MLPDQKTIEELKEKVAPRELHELEIEHAEEIFSLLVAAPTKVEWIKYVSDLTSTEDPAKKSLAHENFILAVTQWPAREEVKGFLAKKFGVLTELTNQVAELVGAGAKVRSKKL